MESTVTAAAAAGKDPTGKVDDLAVLDVSAVQDENVNFEDTVEEDKTEDEEDVEVEVEEEDEDGEEYNLLRLLFGDDQDKQVNGWNSKDWISVREQQKTTQAFKAELSASKKGLGFFCYGTHGAIKPKI